MHACMNVSTIDPSHLLEVTGGEGSASPFKPLDEALTQCRTWALTRYPTQPELGRANEKARTNAFSECDKQFIARGFPLWAGGVK
jgi:hypothetical protein